MKEKDLFGKDQVLITKEKDVFAKDQVLIPKEKAPFHVGKGPFCEGPRPHPERKGPPRVRKKELLA
jgi:hypothetical protein